MRILRYKGNWRLREEVLKNLDQVAAPRAELIEEVAKIVVDTECYFQVRILASKVRQQGSRASLQQPAKVFTVRLLPHHPVDGGKA